MSFFTCVKEFSPITTRYENILVVDGFISNENTEYTVNLSRSMSYDNQHVSMVKDATVIIYKEDGSYTELYEDNSKIGVYKTPLSFRGRIGEKYKLYIKTGGKEYESDFELMQEVPNLDSTYCEIYEKPGLDGYGSKNNGIDIFVDFTKKDNTANFILWEFDETWKFQIPYDVLIYKDYWYCYKTQKGNPSHFLLYDTRNISINSVDNHYLFSIDKSTDRL